MPLEEEVHGVVLAIGFRLRIEIKNEAASQAMIGSVVYSLSAAMSSKGFSVGSSR